MIRLAAFCSSLFLLAANLSAQELTGTLARIAETGQFKIGYVPDAPPMSFHDTEGNVVGYSVDLCRAIAAEVQNMVGVSDLEIVYVPLVAPEERLSAVENGEIDLECAASTVTLSRRERVDFSLMTFITGGSVASLTSRPIASVQELNGTTIAVIPGTTTESALTEFRDFNGFEIELSFIESHEQGLQALREGDVDAYASDRAMLIGQVIQSGEPESFTIARDVFSFEPHGLMLQRGDTDFRLAVDRALAGLYGGARILRLYHEWFGRYGEPLSPFLEAVYEFQAVSE